MKPPSQEHAEFQPILRFLVTGCRWWTPLRHPVGSRVGSLSRSDHSPAAGFRLETSVFLEKRTLRVIVRRREENSSTRGGMMPNFQSTYFLLNFLIAAHEIYNLLAATAFYKTLRPPLLPLGMKLKMFLFIYLLVWNSLRKKRTLPFLVWLGHRFQVIHPRRRWERFSEIGQCVP